MPRAPRDVQSRASADGAGATLLAQEHVGLDISETRQRHDASPQHALEIGDVAGDDAQAVIVEAENMLDRLHLGDGGDGAFEILEADAALGGKLDPKKDGDAKAQFFVI